MKNGFKLLKKLILILILLLINLDFLLIEPHQMSFDTLVKIIGQQISRQTIISIYKKISKK